jgi:hypothetical protein
VSTPDNFLATHAHLPTLPFLLPSYDDACRRRRRAPPLHVTAPPRSSSSDLRARICLHCFASFNLFFVITDLLFCYYLLRWLLRHAGELEATDAASEPASMTGTWLPRWEAVGERKEIKNK